MEMTRKKQREKQVIELAFYVNLVILLNLALILQYLIINVNVVKVVCCCHMPIAVGKGDCWPWLVLECAKQFSSYM